MNHPVKIIIIDQGSPIPRYLLSIITDLIDNIVISTDSLQATDCTGKQ